MNIEKNKTFLLKLPEFNETFNAILISKENKEYLLITLEDKRIFKICLNSKNESECYDNRKTLSLKIKNKIINFLETLNPEYSFFNFNYESFFTNFKSLKFNRDDIEYSLYVEESDDYLKNHDWIAKTISIESLSLNKIFTVFIFRELNFISYCFLQNHEKISKFIFKIEENVLSLIREESYQAINLIDFSLIKNDFSNLTTTSHEMQKDISNSDHFASEMYKKIFTIDV